MARGTERYIVVGPDKRFGPGWSVRRGQHRYWTNVRLKKDAVLHGKTIARSERAELVIKDRRGRIVDRISYGRDAKHRPG